MTIETLEKRARQTGRTTRMVKDAIALSKHGRAVYILVHNTHMIGFVQDLIKHLTRGERTGIKVELARNMREYDWITGRLMTAHPNCMVLIDHSVIAERFRHVLEMFHRYDIEGTDDEKIIDPRHMDHLTFNYNEGK